MAKEQYSVYERASVIRYLELVTKYPEQAAILRALQEISQSHCQLYLQDIEDMLQDIGCPVSLLALPVDRDWPFVAKLPHTDERIYPNFIYVHIGTADEMDMILANHAMTYEDSYANLLHAGILRPILSE